MYFKRLSELRKERALKQKDIAKLLSLAPTIYSRYERGEQDIPVDCLKTLSEFYDVSIDYIVGITDSRTRIIKEDKWNSLR